MSEVPLIIAVPIIVLVSWACQCICYYRGLERGRTERLINPPKDKDNP